MKLTANQQKVLTALKNNEIHILNKIKRGCYGSEAVYITSKDMDTRANDNTLRALSKKGLIEIIYFDLENQAKLKNNMITGYIKIN